MGPFETMHQNVDGVEDHHKKYGANTLRVHPDLDLSVGPHWMSLKKQWRERYLNARRKWRDSRLAALAKGNAQESTYEHVHCSRP